MGAVFRNVEELAGAVLDLYPGGAPLWHLGFMNAAMARARGLEEGHVLLGVYPGERAPWVEPALRSAADSRRGHLLSHSEAHGLWDERFFPAGPLGPTPTPGRAFARGARLAETLAEIERGLGAVAIQGTLARMGEVSLLAFDPAEEGDVGLASLSATADVELVRLAGHSWMPRRH